MKILIVDDQPSSRSMVRGVIEGIHPGLEVHEMGEPDAALAWCDAHDPDLLLLDYRMPGMNGLEFIGRFRRRLQHRDVPIILVTAMGDGPLKQSALDAGVIDFLVKPVRPLEMQARCRNLLNLRQQSEAVKKRALSLEQRLLASMHETEERERETLFRLARAIELRDSGTSAYLERMARVAGLIAQGLGLFDDQVRVIEMAAPLHDLGKIAIPDSLLMKPGPLDAEERRRMQEHPEIGYQLLKNSQNRFIQAGARIALHHHERFDGNGYPQGLAGDDIPIDARVVTVADVFDALISPRPYKSAWSIEAALDFIAAHSGKMFDPECVRSLMAQLPQLRDICARYSRLEPAGDPY